MLLDHWSPCIVEVAIGKYGDCIEIGKKLEVLLIKNEGLLSEARSRGVGGIIPERADEGQKTWAPSLFH